MKIISNNSKNTQIHSGTYRKISELESFEGGSFHRVFTNRTKSLHIFQLK